MSKYYHATPYVLTGNYLYPNEQGLHLTPTLVGAESVMCDRHLDEYDLYEVELPFELKPLVVDFDLSYWSASEIASLLLIKLGEDVQPETRFTDNDLCPEEIHINNLLDKDKNILYNILCRNNNYEDFYEIMDFLATKGFNAIQYPLEESKSGEVSIVVNAPLRATLIGKQNASKVWDYADEMQISYNEYYRR